MKHQTNLSSTCNSMRIMKFATIAVTLWLLHSCVNPPGNGSSSSYGPFDSNGNYVEEWADNPKYSRANHSPPPVSDVDADLVASNTTPLPSQMHETPPPVTTTRTTGTTSRKPTTTTKPKSTAVVKSTTTKPRVSSTASKTKPKTTSRRITVKKGDTLSGLASKYRSSVTAIQRANGLRSTVLQIGKTLVIP